MDNLTIARGLVKPHAIEPLEGHTVVVLEAMGAGEVVRYTLEPADQAPKRRGGFLRRKPEPHFAFAVRRSQLHEELTARVRDDEERRAFVLHIRFVYEAMDPVFLVLHRVEDPLRQVRETIETTLARELRERCAFWQRRHEIGGIVEETRYPLRHFAKRYGLHLHDVSVDLEEQMQDAFDDYERRREERKREEARSLRRERSMDGHSALGGAMAAPEITDLEHISAWQEPAARRIAFRALFPSALAPATEEPFFAYISTDAAGAGAVAADVAAHAGDNAAAWRSAIATRITAQALDRVTVLPIVDGVEFTPAAVVLRNVGSWARASFRMLAARSGAYRGSVQFFAGPVLIGEVAVSIAVTERARVQLQDAGAQAYRNIFVSYSHRDAAIVDLLGKVYAVLGDQYLRDVAVLRSGEEWNPALLAKIEKADVFQLCWSAAAKESEFVEQEWRHALGLQRRFFIRPAYWQKPLPDPPAELAHLHFTFLDLS